MPSAYDCCVEQMSNELGSYSAACRACQAAYYQDAGQLPHEADQKKQNPDMDICPTARRVAQMEGFDQTDMRILTRGEGQNEAFAGEFLSLEDGLQVIHSFGGDGMFSETPKRLVRVARVLEPGLYMASTGPFLATAADVSALGRNFKTWKRRVPFQADHSRLLRDKLGHVLACIELNSATYCLVEIVDKDAIEKTLDGRLREVSIGAFRDPRNGLTLTELSAVVDPAVWNAGFERKEGLSMSAPIAANPAPSDAGIDPQTKGLVATMMSFFSRANGALDEEEKKTKEEPKSAALAALEAQVAEQAKLNAENQKVIASMAATLAAQEFEKVFGKFMASGQVAPVCEAALKAHAATLDAAQTQTLVAFLSGLPKLIELGVAHAYIGDVDAATSEAEYASYKAAREAAEKGMGSRPELQSFTADKSGIVPQKGAK